MPNQPLELELELTFLAKFIPDEVKATQPKRLVDIYVPENSPHPYLRLRQKGDSYEITQKKPVSDTDFSTQTEQTIPLDKDQFEALSIASKRRVVKDRYNVTLNDHPAEVDVFQESLKGLVLIDFEFTGEADKQAFQAPDCCLIEVTQELFIAGGQLAGKGFDDIATELERFNYQVLHI